MNPKDVATAIEQRIPMMWQINWKVPVSSLMEKWETATKLASAPKETEFAACLVCKTGMYLFGKGDYRSWFKAHSKGPCRRQWNEVCAHYGAEPHVESVGATEATKALLGELRQPREEDIPELLQQLALKDKLVANMKVVNEQQKAECENKIRVLSNNYAKLLNENNALLAGGSGNVLILEKPVGRTLCSNCEACQSEMRSCRCLVEDDTDTITGHTPCVQCNKKLKDCDEDYDEKPSHCSVCQNKIHDCSCD